LNLQLHYSPVKDAVALETIIKIGHHIERFKDEFVCALVTTLLKLNHYQVLADSLLHILIPEVLILLKEWNYLRLQGERKSEHLHISSEDHSSSRLPDVVEVLVNLFKLHLYWVLVLDEMSKL
jgi:hypothetical protein